METKGSRKRHKPSGCRKLQIKSVLCSLASDLELIWFIHSFLWKKWQGVLMSQLLKQSLILEKKIFSQYCYHNSWIKIYIFSSGQEWLTIVHVSCMNALPVHRNHSLQTKMQYPWYSNLNPTWFFDVFVDIVGRYIKMRWSNPDKLLA